MVFMIEKWKGFWWFQSSFFMCWGQQTTFAVGRALEFEQKWSLVTETDLVPKRQINTLVTLPESQAFSTQVGFPKVRYVIPLTMTGKYRKKIYIPQT